MTDILTIAAPAKLNLTLEVLGTRPDGFHEVRSILQTISLCDDLDLELTSGVTFQSNAPEWNATESLVSRAVDLMRETTGSDGGVCVRIKKRIPLLAGLGGDSSDAAAVLRLLNRLWHRDLSIAELTRLAARLGSDVPFFVHGGTALAEGRGEITSPLPVFPHRWGVLVVPDVPRLPGKTGRLYAALRPHHYTDGQITEAAVRALRQGADFHPSLLFNTFENVAFDIFPGLRVYRDHILKLGAPYVHLAGSGPALFTLFEEQAQAEDLFVRCRQQRMETYLVETLKGDA